MKFFKSLIQKFTGKPVDWDELEEMLIRSDLGVPMSLRIVAALQKRAADSEDYCGRRRGGRPRGDPARLTDSTGPDPSPPRKTEGDPDRRRERDRQDHLDREAGGFFQAQRHTVLLAAADTFRAAAIEQLGIWAERLGIDMVKGQYNADPAALCYEAYQSADRRDIEFLLCDTAGRLHTKINLMSELEKIKRSLGKHDPAAPHERLLVVDATTGSNALAQAREFHAAVELTGLIVTKLDGSGKGGVVIAIQNELGLPTRFIGTGEKLEDFAAFDSRTFVDQML